MKNICCLALFVSWFCAHPAASRDAGERKIDSLKIELSRTSSDTLKLNLLEALYRNTLCKGEQEGLGYVKEYMAIAQKLNRTRSIEQASRWFGYLYRDCQQDYKKALAWYNKAVVLARKMGDKNEEADLRSSIAQTYESSLDNAKALENYRLSMQINPDRNNLKTVLGNMGNLYNTMGDYPNAADCFEKAYNIQHQDLVANKHSNRNDTLNLIGLLISLADVDIFMAQYAKALENYQVAKEYNRSAGDKYLDLMIFLGIGKCYGFKKEYAPAIENYQAALQISREVKLSEDEAGILNQLGGIYLAMGMPDKAMEYALNARQINEGKQNQNNLPGTYLLLGKIHAAKKSFPKAVKYINDAIGLYSRSGQMDEESAAWNALSSTYEQMNKKGEAFDAYKHYIALRDSIFSLDKARQITSTELRGEFRREQLADSLVQARKDAKTRLHMQQQQVVIYGVFAGLAMVVVVSFFIYRNYKQQKKAYLEITKANKEIKAEKQVSETLLLNILPTDVAEELKTNGKVKAKLFDDVTVLMTDFVGFTIAGERLSPEALVAELHTCFEAFDNIIGKYKIEKIKTVGDAYVAVSGLPIANPQHAGDVIKAAFEIRDFIDARKKKHGADTFGIRIGINSGKLVAGIVGVKKFAYDIWGDTVNTAARMEQEGEEGKINISQATYDLVKNDFDCTYRGEIHAKNKGKLKMYFVNAAHITLKNSSPGAATMPKIEIL